MGANQNYDWHSVAASAIDWWIDAGVDASVDETPRDWLAAIVAPPPAARARPGAPATVEAPPLPALPDTLNAFLAWRVSDAAPEAAWPSGIIAAQGPADAALLVLVDVPEREDAEAGTLLGGAAGRLFDRMLAVIGQSRASIHLVAVCAKRPVTGRIAPDIEERLGEIARHHIALVAPKRVLLLGNAPSRALLGADVAPARESLRVVNLEGGIKAVTVEAVASFHPRFLLERPAQKADAWRDLQMLIGGLDT
ncbi:MAG: uracil-DNA glycosylase [Sphingomonas bacterium]|nr:uracil-DNA glycosylase [Sphingomonas bacterium]